MSGDEGTCAPPELKNFYATWSINIWPLCGSHKLESNLEIGSSMSDMLQEALKKRLRRVASV
jgi:hypothetical protein